MKDYKTPKIDIIELRQEDIITTSPGTETPREDVTDGDWAFSHEQ